MTPRASVKLLPVFLKLEGEPCLVVGGGEVAARKVEALLEAGARVTVIAPDRAPRISELARRGEIEVIEDRFSRLPEGVRVVVAATGDADVNRDVAAAAREAGVPVNVVDSPELSSFFAPAVLRRGDLAIAVSTSGACPALARRVRQQLETQYGPEYAEVLEVLRAARERLKAEVADADERAQAIERMVDSLLALLAHKVRDPELRERLESCT